MKPRVFELLSPAYGWIDFGGYGYPEYSEIEQGKLSKLHWANFFGPRFIETIGKDKLLAAPMRRVEVLSNGGILCTLSSCPGLASDEVDYDKVKSYFNGVKIR